MNRPVLSFGRPQLVSAGALLLTAGLCVSNGGFFPVSWGWGALAGLWAATVALLVGPRLSLSRTELLYVIALVALTVWTFLSALWAPSATHPVLEGERALVLVGAVAAALALGGRRSPRPLLGGVTGALAIVCAYALGTRLLPGRYAPFDPTRLSAPVGYWNGLGLASAVGAQLAFGFAARGRAAWVRLVSAALLLVFLPTLYFTYSRGSWLALGIGLVVSLTLGPRLLESMAALATFAALPALAVVVASRREGLTDQTASLSAATHDGHRMAGWLAVLVVAQLVVALAYAAVRRRVVVPHAVRAAFAALAVGAMLLGAALAFAHYGSPWHLAHRGYTSFTASPAAGGGDLNSRLFSLSGNGRWQLWQVAWSDARAHPILGSGAGTYEAVWNRERPVADTVRDAHNLYLETLAELGIVGAFLLALLLLTPLVAAARARHHPLVPAALGAYVAYLAHATVDWDWELTGVTIAALLVGLACIRAEPIAAVTTVPSRASFTLAVATALAGVVAVVTLAGNTASSAADNAIARSDWSAAARHARSATRWAPWSSRGWQQLGEAELGLHQAARARADLHTALDKDPDNWAIWFDLALASRGAARRDALQEARRLNPLSPEIALFDAAR
jgi:hypothetical protein